MSTTTTSAHSKLPPPFSASPPSSFDLIAQGAEALLFRTTFLTPSTPAALKVRPPKPWRHALLDRRLTRQRILAEARVLVKCRREGVAVPQVLGLDWEAGWLCVEWILGSMVKVGIKAWSSARADGETGEVKEEELKQLLRRVGVAVGKLHAIGVVHGDLTTSNMMIREVSSEQATGDRVESSALEGEIVLIDFGLATQSTQDEDRAVDLYVLERAFGSTHPKEEQLFPVVLEAYGGSFKGAKNVLRRLEDVRMRGRKKSMIG